MDKHNDRFPISKMSETLGVSRSGYYSWKKREPSKRKQENRRLVDRIKEIWEDSYRTYGSPRIHQQLKADGEPVSRPRVARLTGKAGIASQTSPKWIQTTDSGHNRPVADNLLDRDFPADQVGQKWVGDITYLPSRRGWLYLTTVMDLADRQVIGWSLPKSMKAKNTSIAAFKQACRKRSPGDGLIFHSDRGILYVCKAPAESFFKTFKAELLVDTNQDNYKQVRRIVFKFINIWYNRKRLHSSLNYRTPAEMQQFLTKQSKAA